MYEYKNIGKDSCKSSTNQTFCIGTTSITIANVFLCQSAKDITSNANSMSYISVSNSVEHSIVITNISSTEVAQVISSLLDGTNCLHL